MKESIYDRLKWIAQILLPALGALYAALAGIWGWPYAEAVVGSISAVDVFLGAVLMLDSRRYFADRQIVPRAPRGE